MKPALNNPRYLIAIALAVFLCITGITFFIARLLDHRIVRISESIWDNAYRQKVNAYRYEFNNLLKGPNTAIKLFATAKSNADKSNLDHTINTLLLSDAKVNRAWYAVVKGRDTSFTYISRTGDAYRKLPMPAYLKTWLSAQFLLADTAKVKGKMINEADSLHWLTSSNIIKGQLGDLLLGFDINMKELQHSFYDVDPVGVSYAVVVDENGTCILNPNDKLIGTRLYDMKKSSLAVAAMKDGKTRHENAVFSDYLKLSVIRYYVPSQINGMKWMILVDIPEFVFEEDVTAVRTYSVYMGLIAVSIILGLIWLYQRKWQKEFMLRRQIEINRQGISMEKQALSLIAERQEKENALLQLNKLKEKVNPHFLFNSLSSLNALIVQDPDLAKSFVVKLSRVYRYVLDAYPNGLAKVSEELRFVNEYFFLLKIRFGDALKPLELDISEAHLQEKIPFMSLQTLVENAVKHNMLSKSKPLKIRIESVGGHIVVTNNLQLRNDVKDSGKQGLNYLQSSYAYFGDQQLRYGIEGDDYKCYLPVLKLTE